MRLLADENVHKRVVMALREAGHQVEYLQEHGPGATDISILARPEISAFILVTCDSDFGELIFGYNHPSPFAVIFSRLSHRDHHLTARSILAALTADIAKGQFITLDANGVRKRQMPKESTIDRQ